MIRMQLTGWSPDREMQVVSAMLYEIGLSPVNGYFSGSEFLAEQDSDAQSLAAIGSYFAPPTTEQIIAEITSATQASLDTFARTRNYDGILSAATYATSTNPTFSAEGQYCVTARDNTWAALYTIMAEVQVGTRAMPTSFADVEPDLPVLVWPV